MREIVPGDIRYLWLDYKQGTDLPFSPGLEAAEFRRAAEQLIEYFGRIQLIFAPTIKVDFPVGVIVERVEDRRVIPHAIWFNWATHRNKIEGLYLYLTETAQTSLVIVFSATEDEAFFDKFTNYGILSRVGRIEHYSWNGLDDLSDDQAAILYQTIERDLWPV